jgi:membrane protein DedA with SNARE-associated domain
MNLRPFILAGILGRGLRFGLEALFIVLYGEEAIKVVEWILDRELLMGIILFVLLGSVLWWLKNSSTSTPLQQE